MKSKTLSTLIDRSAEYSEISDLIRTQIVKKNDYKISNADRELKAQYKKVLSMLPSDLKLWQYRNNQIAEVRPELDKLSDMYIRKYHKNEYEELLKKIDTESNIIKEAYGEGKCALYKRFADGKINDLHYRMGNAILNEAKRQHISRTSKNKLDNKPKTGKNHSLHYANGKSLSDLKRVLYDVVKESLKNQSIYNEFMKEMEM